MFNSTFDFSLLGLRVPALLISPWLAKGGIDGSPYQNTSALRFLIDRMNAIYKTDAQYLTERDANAPLLDTVFSNFGQKDMREDCLPWIEPYTSLPFADPQTCSTAIPYSNGSLMLWNPPPKTDTASPVRYINELLDIYIRPLPGHPDSGKKITRKFTTNAEVAQYKEEREQAAEAYYKS
jgi:Phosphoesterase family